MMDVLIIEDEVESAAHLKRLVRQYGAMDLQVQGPIHSVSAAIAYLHNNPHPDLIFLDVQLSDGLSFEIFEEVQLRTPIIFTTAYNQFLQRAFEVNSLDFLLKPIRKEHLERSLQKFADLYQRPESPLINSQYLQQVLPWQRSRYKSRFLMKRGRQLVVIPVEQIACLLKEEIIVLVSLTGKRYPFPHTLEEASQLLDPRHFFRINRQCIVHLSAIQEIRQEGTTVLLSMGKAWTEWLAVSQRNTPDFKAWLAGE